MKPMTLVALLLWSLILLTPEARSAPKKKHCSTAKIAGWVPTPDAMKKMELHQKYLDLQSKATSDFPADMHLGDLHYLLRDCCGFDFHAGEGWGGFRTRLYELWQQDLVSDFTSELLRRYPSLTGQLKNLDSYFDFVRENPSFFASLPIHAAFLQLERRTEAVLNLRTPKKTSDPIRWRNRVEKAIELTQAGTFPSLLLVRVLGAKVAADPGQLERFVKATQDHFSPFGIEKLKRELQALDPEQAMFQLLKQQYAKGPEKAIRLLELVKDEAPKSIKPTVEGDPGPAWHQAVALAENSARQRGNIFTRETRELLHKSFLKQGSLDYLRVLVPVFGEKKAAAIVESMYYPLHPITLLRVLKRTCTLEEGIEVLKLLKPGADGDTGVSIVVSPQPHGVGTKLIQFADGVLVEVDDP